MHAWRHALGITALYLVLWCLTARCLAQEYDSIRRQQAEDMLRDVADDVKKHYYDPQLHGIDWDRKIQEAKDKIDKLDSLNRALSQIAAVLDSLDDSHTFFVPPPRPYIHDYGFQMQMIGEHCYTIRVRPGSDAETKGMKAGDEVLTVDGYTPTREDFWKMEYLFNVLRPQPGLRLELRDVNGKERQVDVVATFRQLPALRDITGSGIFDVVREMENHSYFMRVRYAEKGKDLLVVRLPVFMLSVPETDAVIGKMRKYNAVVVDVRGNPGGSAETLRFLLGGMFEKKIKIADRITRGSTKSIETAGGNRPFSGKLVVLIDSKSASASELLARVVQIERRGTVIGDLSAGSVMEAMHYNHQVGLGTVLFYGDSITEADLRMTDGKSLEHKGVTPDMLSLPTASDLGAGRDPVLSQAAEVLHLKLSPEEAGAMFPYEWPKE